MRTGGSFSFKRRGHPDVHRSKLPSLHVDGWLGWDEDKEVCKRIAFFLSTPVLRFFRYQRLDLRIELGLYSRLTVIIPFLIDFQIEFDGELHNLDWPDRC